MFESGYPRELPFEVLQNVFQLAENTLDWKKARNTLYQSLLVCKSWSRPAQVQLYKNPYLPPDKIERFADTLQKRKVGHLVKNVKFLPDAPSFCTQFPFHVGQHLDIILKNCPNIEILGSPEGLFEIVMVWSCLAKESNNIHTRLKLFNLSDEAIDDVETYKLLCLKYRYSLIKLRLGAKFSILKKRLKEFKSLEHLQLWDIQLEALCTTELDDIINDCRRTTYSLELKNRRLVYDHNYTKKINSNNSIKKLQLIDSTLSASSIRYLTNKLAALKTLILNSGIHNNFAEFETREQYAEWWDQLIHLCKPLQDYSVSIDDFGSEDYLHQINGCAYMSTTIANHAREQKETHPTEFTMYLGDAKAQQETYIIEMKQNHSIVRLFNSKRIDLFEQNASIEDIFQTVQPFSPNTIRVLDVERLWDFKDFNSYLDQVFSVKNWNIFYSVISSINNKTGSVVQLDRMRFPPSSFQEQIGQEIISNKTNMSELKLTNCLFYPNVLAQMSSKLPNVDKFILDGCIFMSNSSHQLDIHLPATKLGRLELNLVRIFDSEFFFFPNVDYHTFVLKTDTARTSPCNFIEDAGCRTYLTTFCLPGSLKSFLITIRCKEMQSLVISGVEVFNNSID